MSLIDRNLYSPSLTSDSTYRPSTTEPNDPETQIDNINEIRQLIREQNFLDKPANIIRYRNQYSESSDDLELPVRRFTPLPDIPRYDDPYYRTESRLITHDLDTEQDLIIDDTSPQAISSSHESNSGLKRALPINESKYAYIFEADNFYNKNVKNQMRFSQAETQKINHFASNAGGQKGGVKVHRLPALEKAMKHSLQTTMDLDEDLPMNPVLESLVNRRGIYTSPGERLISPIKRPQAPSPACSEYRRTKHDPKTPDFNLGNFNAEM